MNCLFIGLGGSGTTSLALLNRMLDEHYAFIKTSENHRDIFDGLLKDEYLYIDTDFSTKNKFKDIITDADFCNIGVHAPNTVLAEVKRDSFSHTEYKQRVLDWVDEAQLSVSGQKSLEAGADGLRMLSRMNLFQECISNEPESLYNKLKHKIQVLQDRQKQFNRVNSANIKIRIYIIGGSCGGTGSGIYLDMLYLIHSLYKTEANLIGMDQPDVRPVIIMPHGYIQDLKEGDKKKNYKLNAYAFFQEINAAVKNFYLETSKSSAFNNFSVIPTGIVNDENNKFNPFRFACFYDSISQSPDASFDESSKQLANFIFQLEVTSADLDESFANSFDSSLTNDYIPIAKGSKNAEFINAFLVPGYFSIVKSDELLKAYVKKRLKHEVFQYGILGSETLSLSTEERQYVVNTYEDFITRKVDDFKINFTQLLQGFCGKTMQELLLFSEDIENLSKGISNKIELKAANEALKRFTEGLTADTYAFTPRFFNEFNLRFAFEAFSILDSHYSKQIPTETSNRRTSVEKSMKKEVLFSAKDSMKYRDLLIENFYEFNLKTVLYKLLAEGNIGIFDKCCNFLAEFINSIQYKDNWEIDFKQQIRIAKKDLSRLYIPDLKKIVNERSEIVKNNFFEIQYNKIMLRSKTNTAIPLINENKLIDGTGNSENAIEGSYSVRRIKEQIFSEIQGLNNYFDPTKGNIRYAALLEVIMNSLNKWVIKEAETNYHITSITSKSISQLLKADTVDGLTQAEYNSIVNRFKNTKDVQFQKRNNVTNNEAFTVVFGNFEDNESLQRDLGAEETAQNRMQLKVLKNAVSNDRIVKLRLEYKYNINDYVFYEKEYSPFFAENFKKLGKHYTHQPFLDKRFMGDNYDGNVWKVFENSLNLKDLNVNESNIYDDSTIVYFFLFYLLKLGEQLGRQNIIEPYLMPGYSFDETSKCFKLMSCEWDEWDEKYILKNSVPAVVINVTAQLNPNDTSSYNKTILPWIKLMSSVKSQITDEFIIYNEARKEMEKMGLALNREFLKLFVNTTEKKVAKDIVQFYLAKYKL